jgi:TPR repeat protein
MTFEEYELLAKQGVPEAQYNFGLLFSTGKGVPKDDKEAQMVSPFSRARLCSSTN